MAKKTGSGAPTKKPTLSAIERRAQEMLQDNADGNIDNVFDVIDDLTEIEEELPATSPIRPAWDAFHEECMQIIMDSAKD